MPTIPATPNDRTIEPLVKRYFAAVMLSAPAGIAQPVASQRNSGYAKSDSWLPSPTADTDEVLTFESARHARVMQPLARSGELVVYVSRPSGR